MGSLTKPVSVKVVGMGDYGKTFIEKLRYINIQNTELFTVYESIPLTQKQLDAILNALSRDENKPTIKESNKGLSSNIDSNEEPKSEEIIEPFLKVSFIEPVEIENLKAHLTKEDLVFIVYSIVENTTTDAVASVARISKEAGALTIGVVTQPFRIDEKEQQVRIEKVMTKHLKVIDTLIATPIPGLISLMSKKAGLEAQFIMTEIVLTDIVKLLTNPGIIQFDLEDVKTIISDAGVGYMGFGIYQGQDRAKRAAEIAIYSLLQQIDLKEATRILMCVSGGKDLSFSDIDIAMKLVSQKIENHCELICGTVLIDEKPGDLIRITIIATGFRQQLNC
ncbi:hypothetical protein ACFL35_05060 [Candidatus Riflebacteria bacterium]